MTQCFYCQKVKYWFQFMVFWESEFSWRSTLCKKCGRKIARKATEDVARKETKQ